MMGTYYRCAACMEFVVDQTAQEHMPACPRLSPQAGPVADLVDRVLRWIGLRT